MIFAKTKTNETNANTTTASLCHAQKRMLQACRTHHLPQAPHAQQALRAQSRALTHPKKLMYAILFLCSCLLAISLSACSSSTSNSSSAKESQESGAAATDTATDTTSSASESLRIASLKGPTSIGLAALMDQTNAEESPRYSFEVVASADEISPKLVSGDIDIALIPSNLAATLYARTSGQIQVIDVNTLGVLSAISTNEDLKSLENAQVSDLANANIYMTGKGTVPEYTLNCLFQAQGIDPETLNIQFCSEASEVIAQLQEHPDAVGIVPQPYASSALMQNSQLAYILNLSDEWDACMGDSGRMITGVTVARSEIIEEYPELIAQFITEHQSSAAQAVNDPSSIAQTVVDLGIISNDKLAEKAIPLCNVVCLTGEEMKEATQGYLKALFEQNPEALGGSLPDDSFYYLD